MASRKRSIECKPTFSTRNLQTGTLLAAVFAPTELGVFSGQGYLIETHSFSTQFGVQLLGVVATAFYTFVVTWSLLKAIGVFIELRVSEEEEGLDLISHEARGYDL